MKHGKGYKRINNNSVCNDGKKLNDPWFLQWLCN